MSVPRLTYRCPHCGAPAELEASSSDELLTCPSADCGKPFKAEVPTATPVNHVIVPAGVDPQAGANSAAAATELPIAQPAADREDRIEVVHLDMWRRYPFRCLAYAGVALAGALGIIWFAFHGQSVWMLLSLILFGFALYRLVPWWLRMRHTTLTITNKRCLVEAGVFSKESQAFSLDNVRDIQVNQGLMSRFLNVGDIILSSNEGENKQVVLMAVPDPGRVAAHMRTRH